MSKKTTSKANPAKAEARPRVRVATRRTWNAQRREYRVVKTKRLQFHNIKQMLEQAARLCPQWQALQVELACHDPHPNVRLRFGRDKAGLEHSVRVPLRPSEVWLVATELLTTPSTYRPTICSVIAKAVDAQSPQEAQ